MFLVNNFHISYVLKNINVPGAGPGPAVHSDLFEKTKNIKNLNEVEFQTASRDQC